MLRLALPFVTIACASPVQQNAVPQELPGSRTVVAFVDVSIIPMDAERVLPNRTVVIRDGFIEAIGPRATTPVPAEAMVVAGQGNFFLLPGLADFHTHAHQLADLVGYAANGVTSILQMGQGQSVPVMANRADVNAGRLFGPHIYAGWFIDGPGGVGNVVTTEQAARDQVALAASRGYEFIKVYNSLSLEQFSAIIDEAARRGLKVIGHGVRAPGLEAGLRAGQVMVAHGEEYIYAWFNGVPDRARIPDAVAATKETHAFVTGNPSAYEAIDLQWGKPDRLDAYLARPEVRYLDEEWRDSWRRSDYVRRPGGLGDRLRFVRDLTKAMLDGGVPILLGTDSPAIPGMFPGFSIHDELRNLVAAGFTPYQALQAGTRNAGEFIRRNVPGAEPFGTIAVGQRADLVLLRANPLTDVSHVKSPAGVMVRGTWYNAARLKTEMEAIAH